MQTNEPIPQSNEFDAIPTPDDFDVMMKIHNDMNALSFDDMIQKAREPTILENYKKGMEQMYRMTLGKTRQTWMEPINTKFIVANYLVQKFPEKVFDSKDEPEEVDLNRAGNILFLFFEDAYITTKAGRELSDEQCNGLIDCTIEYIDRFKAWKAKDTPKVTGRISAAMEALVVCKREFTIDPNHRRFDGLHEYNRTHNVEGRHSFIEEIDAHVGKLLQKLRRFGDNEATAKVEQMLIECNLFPNLPARE